MLNRFGTTVIKTPRLETFCFQRTAPVLVPHAMIFISAIPYFVYFLRVPVTHNLSHLMSSVWAWGRV